MAFLVPVLSTMFIWLLVVKLMIDSFLFSFLRALEQSLEICRSLEFGRRLNTKKPDEAILCTGTLWEKRRRNSQDFYVQIQHVQVCAINYIQYSVS